MRRLTSSCRERTPVTLTLLGILIAALLIVPSNWLMTSSVTDMPLVCLTVAGILADMLILGPLASTVVDNLFPGHSRIVHLYLLLVA